MARCYCRWRRVLIIVCTPFISLALLLVYITIMLCMSMNGSSVPGTAVHKVVHFVASGTVRNKSFAPIPKTFWELDQHGDAIWNRLQLNVDRNFNPILHPKKTERELGNGTFYDSLLKQSYSKVSSLDSMRRNFEQLPQEIQDFVSYMQQRNYPTLIQPPGVCGAGAKYEKEPPLLLLAIKSTVMNFKNRQAIRDTWGQVGWVEGQTTDRTGGGETGGYVHRVFLLARENTDSLIVNFTSLLQMESKLYGDILQWDFRDTFFNLTLKDVLFWSWFSSSCSQIRFVFKGDDDVFVNTPKMITYLQDQLKKPHAHKTMEDFMVGDVMAAALPNRDSRSKYFVPDSFYKGHYPVYAGGGGVVYSGLLTKRLHYMSKRVNLFPIDDVYVGMCMIRLNAYPVHHPAFLTFDFPKSKEKTPCLYHTILLVHKRSPDQLVELWADMIKTQAQCWGVPLREADNQEVSMSKEQLIKKLRDTSIVQVKQ